MSDAVATLLLCDPVLTRHLFDDVLDAREDSLVVRPVGEA